MEQKKTDNIRMEEWQCCRRKRNTLNVSNICSGSIYTGNFLAWFSKEMECLQLFACLDLIELLTFLANFIHVCQKDKQPKNVFK